MPMQRSEKEIVHRSEIDAVIDRCLICHLALAADDAPYVIPVCFGYDGRHLYVHTAPEGRKIDLIRRNPQVAFAMETDLRLLEAPTPCKWSFAFESVAGQGRIEELDDPIEKASALHHIVRHYARERHMPLVSPGPGLRIWRIHIEAISGKRSQPLRNLKSGSDQSA